MADKSYRVTFEFGELDGDVIAQLNHLLKHPADCNILILPEKEFVTTLANVLSKTDDLCMNKADQLAMEQKAITMGAPPREEDSLDKDEL